MTYEEACAVWTRFSKSYNQFDYGFDAFLKLSDNEPLLLLTFHEQLAFDSFPYKDPEFHGLRLKQRLELKKKARKRV